jgi:phytanoyl-CoA hydroxylase
MTKHSLTPEQVRHYQIEGYVVVDSIFGRDELARIDATIRELTQRAIGGEDTSKVLELEPEAINGERVPRRIFNPYELSRLHRHRIRLDRLGTLQRSRQPVGNDSLPRFLPPAQVISLTSPL